MNWYTDVAIAPDNIYVNFYELLIYPSAVPASSFEYFLALYLLSIRINAARWKIIADLLII